MSDFIDRYEKDYKYWLKKYDVAKSFMQSRANSLGSKRILIEVAAQHPLVDGVLPNEEFSSRLNFAIQIYKKEIQEGAYVEFYVPGSLHQFEGVPDKIELCEAGKNYLISQGIPAQIIHGKDLNAKYKGDDGVYNSADECFVASHYFVENDFNYLFSVVSPAQMYRKTLFYIEFGVLPLNFSAPTLNSFHNYIDEMFLHIPNVLFEDHSWQEMFEGGQALTTRQNRNPNFKENRK